MDVDRNPTSNLTCHHLTFVGLGGGREGWVRQKKKGLKSINETFDSARSGKKGIFNYMGKEASMLYSYF